MSKKSTMQSFSLFDFDNLPEFEPLENTLELLRPNAYDNVAMEKLLKMDVHDLMDHPQWTELLDLLKPSLLLYNKLIYNDITDITDITSIANIAIKSIRIHYILVTSLNAHQLVDCVSHLLDAFFILFLYPIHNKRNNEFNSISTSISTLNDEKYMLYQTILDLHIDLFMKIIEVISTPSVIGSDAYNVDKIKFAIYTLLSHGVIHNIFKPTDTTNTINTTTNSASISSTIPLYEYIVKSSSTSSLDGRRTGLEYYHRLLDDKHTISMDDVYNHVGGLNIALSSWSSCNSTTSGYILSIAYQTGFIPLLLKYININININKTDNNMSPVVAGFATDSQTQSESRSESDSDYHSLLWTTSVNIYLQLVCNFTANNSATHRDLLSVISTVPKPNHNTNTNNNTSNSASASASVLDSESLRVVPLNYPSTIDTHADTHIDTKNTLTRAKAKSCPMAPPFVTWIALEYIEWSNKKYHQLVSISGNNRVFNALRGCTKGQGGVSVSVSDSGVDRDTGIETNTDINSNASVTATIDKDRGLYDLLSVITKQLRFYIPKTK